MPRPSPLLLLGSTPRAQQAPSSLNRSPTTTPQTKTQNPEPKIHAKKLKIENRIFELRLRLRTPNSHKFHGKFSIKIQHISRRPLSLEINRAAFESATNKKKEWNSIEREREGHPQGDAHQRIDKRSERRCNHEKNGAPQTHVLRFPMQQFSNVGFCLAKDGLGGVVRVRY